MDADMAARLARMDQYQERAAAFAHGQSAGRHDLGLKAKKPNFTWVDPDAFAAEAVGKGVILIFQMHELYDQMLAEGTHVYRFGPGSDGSLSTQRVKPAGP